MIRFFHPQRDHLSSIPTSPYLYLQISPFIISPLFPLLYLLFFCNSSFPHSSTHFHRIMHLNPAFLLHRATFSLLCHRLFLLPSDHPYDYLWVQYSFQWGPVAKVTGALQKLKTLWWRPSISLTDTHPDAAQTQSNVHMHMHMHTSILYFVIP